MAALDEIKKPIASELAKFDVYFRQVMKTNVPLLNYLISYILKRKGKQMRPVLVFLTAKLVGVPNASTNVAAALIEILHTATLIHDDIVDDSDERRGFFSVKAIWKSKISVLLGDYLLAKGLLLAVNNKEYELLEIVSDAVREMSEGELLQLKYSRKLDIGENEYFEIIRKKTATLISSCSTCGAKSVGTDPMIVKKMQNFGIHLGIAFQIKDDLIDFQPNSLSGKPSLNDLKEKKLTLPLIHSLSNAQKSDRRRIIHILNNNSANRNNYNEIISFVHHHGGIEYATSKMDQYRVLALNELSGFPDSGIRNSICDFVNFTTTRKS
jgi:octaprenyl-diphosphate synthase